MHIALLKGLSSTNSFQVSLLNEFDCCDDVTFYHLLAQMKFIKLYINFLILELHLSALLFFSWGDLHALMGRGQRELGAEHREILKLHRFPSLWKMRSHA